MKSIFKLSTKAVVVSAAFSAFTLGSAMAQSAPWHNMGRDATAAEVKAWDIDVRPDFKGLPAGAGSVSQGEAVWEVKCASCHGSFGESNEVFTPIIGGTTKKDIETGRVAALVEGATSTAPQKTTIMKVATLSTIWDYINRAMPWNAPKTLTTDEVYGVTAYLLSLAEIVPTDFTLTDKNIAEVQKRMPNRNGMVFYEPLWKANAKGDVKNVACMKDCAVDPKVHSFLPDFARDAHGNIQEQNRVIGPVRGADTTKPAPKGLAGSAAAAPAPVVVAARSASAGPDAKGMLNTNACTACHGLKSKIVGPGFNEIAAKYKGKADAETYLEGKIKAGGSGVWGAVPMPAQDQLTAADAKTLAKWIVEGAK
ncbi:MAG: c-type cytochrome [Hydrogenophaga sp.]|jgi:cytochrome c|uniref:c-type cytochrome n=1 Tax=Hydrogenophaga sp. TaxID=1904254 RepID=UPI00271DECB8|nr:c-type cytochrome [Hydrogenophaga sp.]MDO9252708.1 c-type cytochrome [Hydrogenophaga sp.]MDP2406888.1 c-type cytochrome [Hydrogenophaga sp.]MDP3323680.1 c-type cytochrome [Hydrogenophaga sp.]MDZ4174183.1 c-type cytochrome [Hydrogenophaga sp.]